MAMLWFRRNGARRCRRMKRGEIREARPATNQNSATALNSRSISSGRDRFIRNVLNAIGNSGDITLVPEAERLLDDASPLVRGAAVWALSRLLPNEEFSSLAARAKEDDASVKDEWTAAS